MNGPSTDALIPFDNTYAAQLPGAYVSCEPTTAPEPVLLKFNSGLAEELGLDANRVPTEQAAEIFSGNQLPGGAEPIAQAYAGHQFGGFVPQLGDGRALLLGEVVDRQGRRRDIALKGSGPTPFSRGGDGKAAVGPVLREYLVGEAMHALGVPTTRALAAVATGELVRRERPLPGAVLTRVAASHLRVGTFEFFAARGQKDTLRTLADYVIQRHDPDLNEANDRYLQLLTAVADRQAALVAHWMSVGFIHGVMNTDNMAISGETIDYGPCAFMETYQPHAVFSSIDHNGRYAYENQPVIARWNLARFAETLLPLIEETSPGQAVAAATEVLEDFLSRFEAYWLAGMRRKLGLQAMSNADEQDLKLARDWLQLLEEHNIDFTLGWRRLADVTADSTAMVEALFPTPEVPMPWLQNWRHRRVTQPAASGEESLRLANPLYIPRNHLVEEALSAATDQSDFEPFERLLDVVTRPFDERPGLERYATPAPTEFTGCYKTFCGT